jgi:hypothetical protein
MFGRSTFAGHEKDFPAPRLRTSREEMASEVLLATAETSSDATMDDAERIVTKEATLIKHFCITLVMARDADQLTASAAPLLAMRMLSRFGSLAAPLSGLSSLVAPRSRRCTRHVWAAGAAKSTSATQEVTNGVTTTTVEPAIVRQKASMLGVKLGGAPQRKR